MVSSWLEQSRVLGDVIVLILIVLAAPRSFDALGHKMLYDARDFRCTINKFVGKPELGLETDKVDRLGFEWSLCHGSLVQFFAKHIRNH